MHRRRRTSGRDDQGLLCAYRGQHQQSLVARLTDNNNYWGIQCSNHAGHYAWAIFEKNAGSYVLRASGSQTFAAGSTYVIAVAANGTNMTATVDGSNPISYASATFNQTATRHGINSFLLTGTWEDFEVTPRMIRAQLLTPWAGDGLTLETAFRPLVAARYELALWLDATGQPAERLPPEPNLCVVEILCEPATLDAILADPEFGADAVLWTEGGEEVVEAEKHEGLRALLEKSGVEAEELDVALGTEPEGRTETELADGLAEWLRGRPKGS